MDALAEDNAQLPEGPGEAVRSVRVQSIAGYISAVLTLQREWLSAWNERAGANNAADSLEVWYRGHRQASYKLLPSAYRKGIDHDSAFNTFRSMAPQFLSDMEGRDTWEWYACAQHHGICTRLLDWTQDPMIGLQFAFVELIGKEVDIHDPPCVWVMEAASLNALTYGEDQLYITDTEGPLRTWLPSLLPASDGEATTDGSEKQEPNEGLPSVPGAHSSTSGFRPVAIIPAWSNRRILAQRGTFTVHGLEMLPIEHYFANSADKRYGSNLTKIIFENPAQITAELQLLGFAFHRLFPEAEHLARDIMRKYS
jgi:FRG domain-containing protein